MERDFMGLNSKEPLASVKRKITDEGPQTQWQSMKNASSHPHFLSFRARASRVDGMKMTSDAITSSAFISTSTPDAFDHGPKTSVGEYQNSPLALTNPPSKPNFTSYSQNLTGTTMTQQFLGIPMTVTSPAGQIVGFTDPWNNKTSLAGPAQMTIFYGGTVSVYDGISHDKAEAIMTLACNMAPSRYQVSLPITKASPITSGVSSTPITKPEPQRAVASRGPLHLTVMTPSAVPQFRKASLARFLEKRKERVMSVGPYNCEKKPQEGIDLGNNNPTSASTIASNFSASPLALTAVKGS